MLNKHFFKILIIFIVLLLIGIIGSFWASSVDKTDNPNANLVKSAAGIAK